MIEILKEINVILNREDRIQILEDNIKILEEINIRIFEEIKIKI